MLQRSFRQRTRPLRSRQSRVLALEALEDRRLLAVEDFLQYAIPATANSERSGFFTTSLREAVIEANTNGRSLDIIALCPDLPGLSLAWLCSNTFQLSSAGSGEDAAATGDLDITADTDENGDPLNQIVVILGNGADQTVIDANSIDRIFDVHPGATLAVAFATLRNGGTDNVQDAGAVIRNRGNLILYEVVVESGSATAASGGGIANFGDIDVDQLSLQSFTDAQDEVVELLSMFEAMASVPSVAEIQQIAASLDALSEQVGIGTNGKFFAVNSTITGNAAASSGGGIQNEDGLVALVNSTVSDNSSVDGGGVNNRGGVVLSYGSTISGNSASDSGGGVHNEGESVFVAVNSTVSGNDAASGGGIANDEFGVVGLVHTTITGNEATDTSSHNAGGILNSISFAGSLSQPLDPVSTGFAFVQNSLIAENTLAVADTSPVDSLAGPFQGPDVAGLFLSGGGNLIGNDDGSISQSLIDAAPLDLTDLMALATKFGVAEVPIGFDSPADIVDVDPLLGPLAFNGGNTQTHALLPNSPAIDLGVDRTVASIFEVAVPVDQRGSRRPVDGDRDGERRSDAGAYEFGLFSIEPPADIAGGLSFSIVDGEIIVTDGNGQEIFRSAVEEVATIVLNLTDRQGVVDLSDVASTGIEIMTHGPIRQNLLQVGDGEQMMELSRFEKFVDYGHGWRAMPPTFVNDKFVHVLHRGDEELMIGGLYPWTNPVSPFDIDANGQVVPEDAMKLINVINNGLGGVLPATPSSEHGQPLYLDPDGSGTLIALDVLNVIQFINNAVSARLPGGPEPEDGPAPEDSKIDVPQPIADQGHAADGLAPVPPTETVSPTAAAVKQTSSSRQDDEPWKTRSGDVPQTNWPQIMRLSHQSTGRQSWGHRLSTAAVDQLFAGQIFADLLQPISEFEFDDLTRSLR